MDRNIQDPDLQLQLTDMLEPAKVISGEDKNRTQKELFPVI
jgi:hypothetical protein